MGLKYYSDMKYATLSYLFIQASIKTDNQLVVFSDYSWQDWLDTSRSTGAYIIFYKGWKFGHGRHVPVPVPQSISESEYNKA